MKQNWTYKKLGEVCDVLDSKRKPITKSDRQPGNIPYYGATGIQDYVKDYIFEGRFLLVGEDGAKWGKNDNTAYIIEGKSWVNNHAHILKMHDDAIDAYVRYFLNGKDLNCYITGAIVQKLTQAALVNISIPLPPLETQSRIVSELDLLQSIIDKQKAQLTELDNLAQAVFYDMFGDPVENEKGWKVKTIGELVDKSKNSLKRGPFGGALKKEIFVNDGFLVYEQYHALNNDFTFGRYFITEDKYHQMKEFKVEPDDILISCSGVNLGKLAIVPSGAKQGIMNQALLKLRLDQNIMTNIMFVYIFSNENFKKKYFGDYRGCAIPNFPPMTEFKKFSFPVPPLSLQQSFAAKIESIEKQKAAISKSIAETEKLFEYTMDSYFG